MTTPPQLKPDGTPYKIAWIGDLITPTGFGRIGNHVTVGLHNRGWQMFGASFSWGGFPPNPLPFPVFGLAGKADSWGELFGWVGAIAPDLVIICQDFPYSTTIYNAPRVDWSVRKFVIVTPIDGTPVHTDWVKMSKTADAIMAISKFGVEALRQEGVSAGLLQPGVDHNEFRPAESPEERAELRAKVGIPADAFVIGSFMMNQGRKAVPKVIEFWREFALDKPDCHLWLDMEKVSPAGWDIPNLLKQMRFTDGETKRVHYREDAFARAIFGLRERYLLCDITAQLAHREGFGLPNIESMACKIPPTVMDWCSGSEIAGSGAAILIRRIDYMEHGTWGGARDGFPDGADLLRKWNAVYLRRDWLAAIATKGYYKVKEFTWDKATNAAEETIKRVLASTRKQEVKRDDTYYLPGNYTDAGDSRANPPAPIAPIPADTIYNHPILQQPSGAGEGGQQLAGNGRLDTDGTPDTGRRQPGGQSAGGNGAGGKPPVEDCAECD